MSTGQDSVAFLVGLFTVTVLLVDSKGRDDRRMVEGEHHHRNRQPQGLEEQVQGHAFGGLGEEGAVPVGNQAQGQQQQRRNEGIDQQAHDLDDDALTTTDHDHQAADQQQGQQRPRWWGHVQLMFHEAAQSIGQRHAVHQQDREDRQEVQQGDQLAGTDAEMLFNHFSDVFAGTPLARQHETGQATVSEVRHGECQQRQYQQRPEAPYPGVDRQEQGSRANCGAVQAQDPGSVVAVPGFALRRRGCADTQVGGGVYISHRYCLVVVFVAYERTACRGGGLRPPSPARPTPTIALREAVFAHV
ncbi:hypothetical protein D3C78_999210 [compost metagenome]